MPWCSSAVPDPRDAAVAASDEEFRRDRRRHQTSSGLRAARLLDESFLYSAAKRGLTTVRVDTSKMSIETDDDEFPLRNGGLLCSTYTGRLARGHKDGPKHHVNMMASLPDQDLALPRY